MQKQITEIQEVNSVTSSMEEEAPRDTFNSNGPNKVHFHADIDSLGLNKIDEFIQYNHISLEEFWKAHRQFAGYEDIREMCREAGLQLDQEDEVELKCNLFKNTLAISIFDFKNLFKSWKGLSQIRIQEFLQKRETVSDNIFQQTEKRDSRLTRPLSSINFNRARPQSSTDNKSIQYLRQQKSRKRQQENKLAQAINKAKNEEEYEVLIKMGQANDLNRQMQSLITFRAYKNAQGNLKVRVFNLDAFEKEINLEEFNREFNTIKKKYNESKNLNVWELLSAPSNNLKKNQQPLITVAKKNLKTVDKEKKKRKLVEILKETISLTNVFKEQLRILKAQGICTRAL